MDLTLIALNSLNEKIYKGNQEEERFLLSFFFFFNDSKRHNEEERGLSCGCGPIWHKKRLAESQIPRKELVRK